MMQPLASGTPPLHTCPGSVLTAPARPVVKKSTDSRLTQHLI